MSHKKVDLFCAHLFVLSINGLSVKDNTQIKIYSYSAVLYEVRGIYFHLISEEEIRPLRNVRGKFCGWWM